MHELELNKIYCMDCLEGLKLIPDNSIDLVVTSPPYNLGVFIKHKKDIYTEYNDKNLVWKDLIKNSLDECLRVAKNEVFYNIQYVSNNKVDLFEIIGEYKTKIKDILIWEKTLPAPAINAHVLTHSYEFIFVFSNNANTRAYKMDFGLEGKCRTSFAFLNNDMHNPERFACEGNFAVMSVQVARHILSTFSNEGDTVLDPFMGSGTTAVACKQLQRNFIGFELSQKYVDIANRRLQQDTLFTYDILNVEED